MRRSLSRDSDADSTRAGSAATNCSIFVRTGSGRPILLLPSMAGPDADYWNFGTPSASNLVGGVMNVRAVARGGLIAVVLLLAGCGTDSTDSAMPEAVSTDQTVTAGTEGVSTAAGFEYEDRRYETSCAPVRPEAVEANPLVDDPAELGSNGSSVTAVHRLVGVDEGVLLAVKMNEPCSLDPEASWLSAFAAQELRGPRSPS